MQAANPGIKSNVSCLSGRHCRQGAECIFLAHVIDLARTVDSRHPRNPIVGEELGSRLDAVNDIDVVKDAGLDDSHAIDATETVAVAE